MSPPLLTDADVVLIMLSRAEEWVRMYHPKLVWNGWQVIALGQTKPYELVLHLERWTRRRERLDVFVGLYSLEAWKIIAA